jgi:hypothetical protein
LAPGLISSCFTIGSGAGYDLSSVSCQPVNFNRSHSRRARSTPITRFYYHLPSTSSSFTLLVLSSVMSSPHHSVFAHLEPIHRSHDPSKISNPAPLISSFATPDTDTLMSHFSPIVHSSRAEHSSPPPISSTLQTVLENIQTQMRSFSDRFDRLERVTASHSPAIKSVPINIDLRPSSYHSLHVDQSSDSLSERFLRVKPEYHRLELELATRSPTSNHNLRVSHSIHSPPSSFIAPATSVRSPSLPFYPTHLSTTPPTICHCQSSSAFQPIPKSFSPTLSSTATHVIVQPNPLSPPVVMNYLEE